MEYGVLTRKSVSWIFKEPIKFPIHSIKQESFIHRPENAREEGWSINRYPQKSLQPCSSRGVQIQNQPLRPARRSKFGPVRQPRVSAWSGNTIQRDERVGLCQDPRFNRSLLLNRKRNELILFPHKNALFPTIDFLPTFSQWRWQNSQNGLSKLHYRFRRYSTLTKTVLLESQYLQSYGSLSDFLRPNLKKIVITLQILRFKQNCLSQSWISSKSIMQLTETLPPNSAIFIEKKWVENRLWGKRAVCRGKKMYHERGGSHWISTSQARAAKRFRP